LVGTTIKTDNHLPSREPPPPIQFEKLGAVSDHIETNSIYISGVACDITCNGMFGIGACDMPFLGFEVRAVDLSKPFVSSTGYRSFLGCSVSPEDGLTPDRFAARVIKAYIANDLRGKLVPITS
jgi:hypothetical protein